MLSSFEAFIKLHFFLCFLKRLLFLCSHHLCICSRFELRCSLFTLPLHVFYVFTIFLFAGLIFIFALLFVPAAHLCICSSFAPLNLCALKIWCMVLH